MTKNILIGIDLGGTKIMTGAVSSDGTVLCEPFKIPTDSHEPADKILTRITGSVEEVLQRLKVAARDIPGIGIGATGPLDIASGKILDCPQLPTMHDFPLRDAVGEHFGVPVRMNNDANCLIYGEVMFGAAAGRRHVLGFTLGTGLGAAVIIDRKIFNGATGTAGELWISPWNSGIIEDYVSGRGVAAIFRRRIGRERSSEEIHKLAAAGDTDAMKTWEEFGRHLAVAMAWGINLLDPEMVVLGGSVSHAHEFFMPALWESLRKNICNLPAQNTKIVMAELGDYAGFIGAACLVLENKTN